MGSGDRFYLLEFRNRPVLYGDIGSLLRISGLLLTGGGASIVLTLPGTVQVLKESAVDGKASFPMQELDTEEWSDFIRRSDNPEILVGLPKTFQRKVRYEISGAIQQKVWAADGFECMYCGAKMGQHLLTIDHFIPLELGGANDVTNFVTSCRRCNKDKGSEAPEVWMEGNRFRSYKVIANYLKDRVIK
jgi:HNH endonuclease